MYEYNFFNHPNKNLYIFNTLNCLLKNNDLRIATFIGCNYYTLDIEDVMRLVVSGGYVDDSVNYENWDEFANDSLTIPILKDILRDNNLKVSGRKQELITRIRENNIPLDNFKTDKVKITQKGYDFLKEYEYIAFYDKYLKKFDFNEFNTFYESHSGSVEEISSDFLDEQINNAYKNKDEDILSHAVAFKFIIENFLNNK